jgi:hypothetical protein
MSLGSLLYGCLYGFSFRFRIEKTVCFIILRSSANVSPPIHQLLSALIISLSITAVAIYQRFALGWNICEPIISTWLSRCVDILEETLIYFLAAQVDHIP